MLHSKISNVDMWAYKLSISFDLFFVRPWLTDIFLVTFVLFLNMHCYKYIMQKWIDKQIWKLEQKVFLNQFQERMELWLLNVTYISLLIIVDFIFLLTQMINIQNQQIHRQYTIQAISTIKSLIYLTFPTTLECFQPRL